MPTSVRTPQSNFLPGHTVHPPFVDSPEDCGVQWILGIFKVQCHHGILRQPRFIHHGLRRNPRHGILCYSHPRPPLPVLVPSPGYHVPWIREYSPQLSQFDVQFSLSAFFILRYCSLEHCSIQHRQSPWRNVKERQTPKTNRIKMYLFDYGSIFFVVHDSIRSAILSEMWLSQNFQKKHALDLSAPSHAEGNFQKRKTFSKADCRQGGCCYQWHTSRERPVLSILG